MSIDTSATAFRRKISSFCEVKLTSLLSTAELRAFSAYMLRLIDDRTPPPMMGRHVDWIEVTRECGLSQTSAKLRRVAQYGFDAISRWLDESTADRSTDRATPRAKPVRQRSNSTTARKESEISDSTRAKPGPKPKQLRSFQNHSSTSTTIPFPFRQRFNFISIALVKRTTICIEQYFAKVMLLKQRILQAG